MRVFDVYRRQQFSKIRVGIFLSLFSILFFITRENAFSHLLIVFLYHQSVGPQHIKNPRDQEQLIFRSPGRPESGIPKKLHLSPVKKSLEVVCLVVLYLFWTNRNFVWDSGTFFGTSH